MFQRPFSVSGYTTTLNCVEMEYPFELSIKSLLGFCDEVVVVDSGSTDNTLDVLERLRRDDSRIKIFVEPVDFKHPRWAIYNDGYLKGRSRAHCTGDYCWQMDVDEIVVPEDFNKIKMLPELMGDFPIIMLPMVEFWGCLEKIRADFFSWKLRFSKNDPNIVHGIPKSIRMYDSTGHEYPRPFLSDCCNYLYKQTEEDIPFTVRVPQGYPDLRGAEDPRWEQFFNASLDMLPSVLHVSWLDLPRKIRHYRKFWHRYQFSMYNLIIEDAAETNVMFDKEWSQITDADIAAKAAELARIGPRGFHHKIDPTKIGRTSPFTRPIPAELRAWHESIKQRAQPAKSEDAPSAVASPLNVLFG